jgi:Fuc2NAc and GlcNAc transferase
MILALIALALGAIGAFMISRFGWRLGLVDRPTARSSHAQENPKGGGVGIAAAFLLASVFLDMPIAFWLPLAFMAGVSLQADRVDIPPKWRLPAHFILVGILVIGTGKGLNQGMPGSIIALFWIVFIVGTANFYNFMDGINGLAGISGAIGFGLLAFTTCKDHPDAGLLAICMVLACLGFLPFNLPDGRVFMGDVGSILLGSVFAGLVYLASRTFMDFICRASFLFPFFADELTSMAVRLRSGENLTRPHRRHLYQLLANELRIPHWRVAAAYGLFQLLVGVSVWLCKPLGVAAVLVLLAAWSALFVICCYYIRREGF